MNASKIRQSFLSSKGVLRSFTTSALGKYDAKLLLPSNAQAALRDLPEFTEACEQYQQGKFDTCHSLVNRVVEVAGSINIPAMHSLSLEASANLNGLFGKYAEEGELRLQQKVILSGGEDAAATSLGNLLYQMKTGNTKSASEEVAHFDSLEASVEQQCSFAFHKYYLSCFFPNSEDNENETLKNCEKYLNELSDSELKTCLERDLKLLRVERNLKAQNLSLALESVEDLENDDTDALVLASKVYEAKNNLADAVKSLSAAIELYQSNEDHLEVCRCLSELARIYHQRGEGLTSEGLFRSCVDTLDILSTPGKPQLLRLTLNRFADLLENTSFNNKPRTGEADKLRKDAEDVVVPNDENSVEFVPKWYLQRHNLAWWMEPK